MDKLDMFQARFGKVDDFGWWDIERIQTYASTQFTSKEFQGDLSLRWLLIELFIPYHQEMNGQVEVTWQKLRTVAHSIMVNARVLGEYILLELMHMTDNVISILSIKHFVKQDGGPTTPHTLATSKKPST